LPLNAPKSQWAAEQKEGSPKPNVPVSVARSTLAEATQTNKKTAAIFLDTLSALAYKTIKKNGELVLPGFGKLVKQKRKARTALTPRRNRRSGFQPKPCSRLECHPPSTKCPRIAQRRAFAQRLHPERPPKTRCRIQHQFLWHPEG
jgi:nucleoid DNA-binding protein